MKKHLAPLFLAAYFCVLPPALAAEDSGASQREYEKEIEAVVRNKHFYKSGRFELTGTAGVMPYDSVINHYMFGGRLDWHLSDHYGWEIVDLQVAFPSVTGFTTNLVSSKGLSNLQTVKLKTMVASNFLLSPVYGKIRFFGRQTLYFDVYLVAGIGMANTEVLGLSATGANAPAVETSLKTGWDPMFDFGFGFKIFMNDALGLVIDMRDYVVSSQVYGGRSLKSNFSVFAGLSFYLPTY